jgi:hypothetical protein
VELDALLRQLLDAGNQVRLVEVSVRDQQYGARTVLGQAVEQGFGPVEGLVQTAALEPGQVGGQGR